MDSLSNLLFGELSDSARVWTALAPALLIIAYFAIGGVVYIIRYASVGPYIDEEIEKRGSSILTPMWIRRYFVWLIRPLWVGVRKTGVPATAITTLSLLLASASGVAFAAGRFALGGWLFIFAGVCDLIDGRLARATGQAGPRGAALDSVLDRYSDSVVLIGLAWYYRSSWVLLVVIIAMVGSLLVSYVRARGEGLGVEVKVGLMQRPERVLYLGAFTALSPIVEVWLSPGAVTPIHHLAVVGIVMLAISSQYTALRRLIFLLRSLGGVTLPKWLQGNRQVLLRLLLSAVLATAADFMLFNTLHTAYYLHVPYAVAIGCVLGAVVNFTLNRLFIFGKFETPAPQVRRYAFVSLTSTLLNASGVALLLSLPFHYLVAWLLVRLAVSVTWNLPLQRNYVFGPDTDEETQPVEDNAESSSPAS